MGSKKRLQSLLTLLDDEDPSVLSAVEKALIQWEKEEKGILQKAYREVSDAIIKKRLFSIARNYYFPILTQRLYQWRKQGGKRLWEGWELLSQLADPFMEVKKTQDAIRRLAHLTWLKGTPQSIDVEKLHHLSVLLFKEEGFAFRYGNTLAMEDVLMHAIIQNKQGSSLGLCMLYAIIANALQIPLQVIKVKERYYLRYYSTQRHFYIDVHNQGQFFDIGQMEVLLRQLKVEDVNLFHYKPLSNIYLIQHVIKALEHIAYWMQDWEERQYWRKIAQAIAITW